MKSFNPIRKTAKPNLTMRREASSQTVFRQNRKKYWVAADWVAGYRAAFRCVAVLVILVSQPVFCGAAWSFGGTGITHPCTQSATRQAAWGGGEHDEAEPTDATDKTTVSLDQVQQLIDELSHRNYTVRTRAAQQLKKAGTGVLFPVARAFLTAEPETRASCAAILQAIVTSPRAPDRARSLLVIHLLSEQGFRFLEPAVAQGVRSWKVDRIEANIARLEKQGFQILRASIGGGNVVVYNMADNQELDVPEQPEDETRPEQVDLDGALRELAAVEKMNQTEVEENFRDRVLPSRAAASAEPDVGPNIHVSGMVLVGDHFEVIESGHGPIFIQSVSITDQWNGDLESIRDLASLPNIPMIRIEKVKVTRELLDTLAAFSELRQLFFDQTDFDVRMFRQFFDEHPNIYYNLNPKSFLGVTGPTTTVDRTDIPCEIQSVNPDTAAEAAGLQPGDVVTQLGDFEIERFQDLVLIVAVTEPGQALPLKFIRDGKEQETTVTLRPKFE